LLASSIFPENDREEKQVNQLYACIAGGNSAERGRATISLRRLADRGLTSGRDRDARLAIVLVAECWSLAS
jgi:hypothetical protein